MPHDVAADRSLRRRFQYEVAYLDRLQPTDSEAGADTQLLGSKFGVQIIAWLWPSLSYEPSYEPFDGDLGDKVMSDDAAAQPGALSAEARSDEATIDLDFQRRARMGVAATRFLQLIRSTARVADRSEEDVMTHIQWSVPLSQFELARLLVTHTPFPFRVIVGICEALQLEFTQAWVVVDPQGLATSIDQSVLASRISDRLHALTAGELEAVENKLPRQPPSADQDQGPERYLAPRPGGRYWSLYEALASEPRDAPEYTLAELDKILLEGGEQRLPESARNDRSWWAGSGTRTEGHPQIAAWWAAGYRICELGTDHSSGGVRSVRFEALPGRAEWLADPTRTARREYQVPGPEVLEVYRSEDDIELRNPDPIFTVAWIAAIAPDLGATAASASRSMSAAVQAALEDRPPFPDDPDILHLVEFLDEVGEADRTQIERHFNRGRPNEVSRAWLTNLLTRARRQGWTINYGTRRRPRWASTTSLTAAMSTVADGLELGPLTSEFDLPSLEELSQLADALPLLEMARSIIESNGGTWQEQFESANGQLTGLGLRALAEATGTVDLLFDSADGDAPKADQDDD